MIPMPFELALLAQAQALHPGATLAPYRFPEEGREGFLLRLTQTALVGWDLDGHGSSNWGTPYLIDGPTAFCAGAHRPLLEVLV